MSTGKLWSSIEEEGHSPRLCSLQGQIWWTFLYLLSEEQCEPRRPFPQCISRRYLTDVGVSGRCWRRWWPWGGSYMWRAMWCALCCYCCCSVCCSMPARWASNQSQSQLDITLPCPLKKSTLKSPVFPRVQVVLSSGWDRPSWKFEIHDSPSSSRALLGASGAKSDQESAGVWPDLIQVMNLCACLHVVGIRIQVYRYIMCTEKLQLHSILNWQ